MEDDEFLVQLNMLRSDCDSSYDIIEDQMNDIQKVGQYSDQSQSSSSKDILDKINLDSELPFK